MERRAIKKKAPYVEKTLKWLEKVSDRSLLYRDIDPFHQVFQFTEHVYSIFEECANGGSDLWINLIEGESAALLVDTGYGIGDLAKLVRHLIGDKKLYVVNTHEHYDHVLGNCRRRRRGSYGTYGACAGRCGGIGAGGGNLEGDGDGAGGGPSAPGAGAEGLAQYPVEEAAHAPIAERFRHPPDPEQKSEWEVSGAECHDRYVRWWGLGKYRTYRTENRRGGSFGACPAV